MTSWRVAGSDADKGGRNPKARAVGGAVYALQGSTDYSSGTKELHSILSSGHHADAHSTEDAGHILLGAEQLQHSSGHW